MCAAVFYCAAVFIEYESLFLPTDQMGEMNALYYYSTQEDDDMDQLSIQKYHPNSPWFLANSVLQLKLCFFWGRSLSRLMITMDARACDAEALFNFFSYFTHCKHIFL